VAVFTVLTFLSFPLAAVLVRLPVYSLAVDRAVGGVPTRRAFLHFGVGELATARVALDLFGLLLPPFFALLLALPANG